MEDFELKDYKIFLLFMEDNSSIDWWMEIEKDYIKEKLMNAQGNVYKNYDIKHKHFVQNDVKALYGLCCEDIHYLADLFE